MTPDHEFTRAEPGDETAVRDLAASAGVPFSDISVARQEFVQAERDGEVQEHVKHDPEQDRMARRPLEQPRRAACPAADGGTGRAE